MAGLKLSRRVFELKKAVFDNEETLELVVKTMGFDVSFLSVLEDAVVD